MMHFQSHDLKQSQPRHRSKYMSISRGKTVNKVYLLWSMMAATVDGGSAQAATTNKEQAEAESKSGGGTAVKVWTCKLSTL